MVRPLGRAVAQPLPPGRGSDRPGCFGCGDVDLGVREIGEAAGVVKVEVRENNVPDIVTAEAEPFDLACGGLCWVKCRPEEVADRPDSPCRVCDVVQTVPGVDQ